MAQRLVSVDVVVELLYSAGLGAGRAVPSELPSEMLRTLVEIVVVATAFAWLAVEEVHAMKLVQYRRVPAALNKGRNPSSMKDRNPVASVHVKAVHWKALRLEIISNSHVVIAATTMWVARSVAAVIASNTDLASHEMYLRNSRNEGSLIELMQCA